MALNSPFSNPGFDKFLEKIEEHFDNLYYESKCVSKELLSDDISAGHVEIASAYLVPAKPSKVPSFIGNLGGVFLGAVFGVGYDIAKSHGNIDIIMFIFTAVLLISATICLSYQYWKS